MNNGTRRVARPTPSRCSRRRRLEDLWQLHWSHNVGVEHNAPGVFIANIDDNETIAGGHRPAAGTARRGAPVPHRCPERRPDPPRAAGRGAAGGAGRGGGGGGFGGGAAAAHTPAYWLKVSAERDGTFTVTNPRNGFSKTYRPVD